MPQAVFRGIDDWEALLEAMPTRRLNMHLRRNLVKNKQFPIKTGDLSDWSHLGVAAMYCDAIVCEKAFGRLLNHDGFHASAKVVRSPNELVEYLETAKVA